MWPIPSNEGALLVIWWLKIYGASLLILLSGFYVRERVKAGPIAPRVILIMTQIAALLAMVPATAYVIVTGLIRKGR